MARRAQRRFRGLNGLSGLKDRHWQQTVPPVRLRGDLWVLRRRLQSRRSGGFGWGPYKHPWLPNERRRPMRRFIQLERESDTEY